jgi:5-methylcytosine-specific restriction endonuclease McrA
MSAPRYLKDFIDDYLANASKRELCAWMGTAGADIALRGKFDWPDELDIVHMLNCRIRHLLKMRWHNNRTTPIGNDQLITVAAVSDELEKVPVKIYIGQKQSSSGFRADFRDAKAIRLAGPRIEKWNAEREEKDLREMEFVKRRLLVIDKIYTSRLFPSSLRALIFERDGYKCVICARDREALANSGRKVALEVDHVHPYVDGGLTTYSNGQTLCDECNKAKHHTKTITRESFYFNHTSAQ